MSNNNNASYDNGIDKFNQEQKEQQTKEEISSSKPKISKKTASLIIQYGMIGLTVIGIFYKMFIEDTSGAKTDKPVKFVKKEAKEENFGAAKIEASKKANIASKSETPIIGIDTGFKAKPKIETEIPALTLPKVPEVKLEDKEDSQSKLDRFKEAIKPDLSNQPSLVMPEKSPIEKAKELEAKAPLNGNTLERLENRNNKEKNNNESQRPSQMQANSPQVNSALGGMFLVKGSGGMSEGRRGSNSGESKDGIVILNGSRISAIQDSKTLSQAQEVKKNLSNTILPGKLIEAVLETAINTQMPGMVRAVVSRDVYAENGGNVLIPAGSRLYGTYVSSLTVGDARVGIMWNKIARPDGVSISINAQAVDSTGKAGIAGDVDSGYMEMFKNSMLLSFISLGTAIATQKLFNLSGQSQVVNSNGSVATTNITPANAAMQNVVNLSSNVAKQITSQLSQNVKTIATIDQGTIVNVLVNQDIVVSTYFRV